MSQGLLRFSIFLKETYLNLLQLNFWSSEEVDFFGQLSPVFSLLLWGSRFSVVFPILKVRMTLYMFLNYILTGIQFKYGKYIPRLFREERNHR